MIKKAQWFTSETFWSSALQHQDLKRVTTFLEENSHIEIDVSLVTPPSAGAHRVRWSTFYDSTGQCISASYEMPIPDGSRFLNLAKRYQSAEARDAGLAQITLVANALRLIFGVPAARERVLVVYSDDTSSEKLCLTVVGFASKFDNQNLNFFENPPIETAQIRAIPMEASVLLDKAFLQTYAQERFILMWLAFEAIMHTHEYKGSNGRKRKSLFRDELGSGLVNDEVNRIRCIRNDSFKEGLFESVDFEEACWSLYAAIQLALLVTGQHRLAFLRGYENYILSRDNRSAGDLNHRLGL